MKTLISIILILTACVTTTATPPYAVQQVVVPQRVVTFDDNYYQGLNGYFSVGEKLRAEKQEEKNTELEYYKGQIDMLLKVLANKGINTEAVPTPNNPIPQPPTVPTPPDNGEYKVTEVDKKVYNIFKAKCARCHGDTQQDGGLALIKDGALQLVDIYDRVEIHDRVSGISLEQRGKARMPKGGNVLADDEVETMRLWMVQESDQNRHK